MSDAPKSPLAAPDAWNRVVDGYVTDVAPVLAHYAAEALRLADVRPGMSILDVAAGPGTLAVQASKLGAQVSAIDFSTEMIDRLQKRTALENLQGITAALGDGMALPFADASFDAGFSMFGLMFFPDRARGFAELLRVLKPGAKAVISSWVPMTNVPLMAATFAVIGEHLPDLMPAKPIPLALSDPAACRDEMTAAGFVDVEITEHTASYTAPSTVELVTSFERSNAAIASLAARAGDRWAAARAALLEKLTAQFGPGQQTMSTTALLTSGARPADTVSKTARC